MKIIDLLNKIANGENVEFIFKNGCSIQDNISLTDALIDYLSINYGDTEDDTNWLNDEVEILEEEKKIPEELPKSVTDNAGSSKDMRLIAITLNEIIDYLKSKGE